MADKRNMATRRRQMYQETLRDFLSKQKLVEKVVDIAQKFADEETELDQDKFVRLKAAADINLKLIAKYMPDMRHMEVENTSLEQTTDDELDGIIRELKKRVPERAKATTH